MRRVPRVTCVCEQCGKEFKRVPSLKGKFCSRECYRLWQKDNITPPPRGTTKEYTCHFCGKKFTDAVSSKRKYCSRKCYEQHSSQLRKGTRSKDTVTRKCLVCGKKIYVEKSRREEGKGKFCSKECYAEWQHETMQGKPFPWKVPSGKNHPSYKGKIEVNCANCGKKFEAYPHRVKEHENLFCCVDCARSYDKIPSNESIKHIELKNIVKDILEDIGFGVDLEKWITFNHHHYKIDIYGVMENKILLVECGYCPKHKLKELRKKYDVYHLSYKNRNRKIKELKEYASTYGGATCKRNEFIP